MCGISGILGPKATKLNISKMTEIMHHRGHDSIQHFQQNGITLGHNRLSIIDLNEGADQPFQRNDSPWVLVYNGEIYNYVELREELIHEGYTFDTQSDTEVLYRAFLVWGENCLEKLNGMFAFAFFNTKTNKLFAARDRFGVKPFYYYHEEKNFIFASEIKAIKQLVNPTLNEKVLANYLAYGSYGMPDESFYKNIQQLPGSHFLNYKENKLQINQWYDFVSRTNKKILELQNTSEDEAKEEYKKILKNSIDLRFRADVPVGFTLSGGVDSSLLLALVNQREEAKNIKAFTFYTDDERYDELPWVEQMVAKTQTQLDQVLLKSDEVNERHQRLSKIQDEPYGGIPTIAYAKVFETMANQGIKVILDGQGMDEAWAGYDYYQNNTNNTIQGQSTSSPYKINVLSDSILAKAQKPTYPQPFNNDLLNKQYRDLFYTKIPRALRFNDRVSMTSTTELREPFLDYRLVEFAFSLPKHFKIRDRQGKFLLREILSDYSKNVAFAPKRPLQTPQREWLAEELKLLVNHAIASIEKSSLAKHFDVQQMKVEWEDYKNGNQTSSFHIWQWISVSKLVENE
ncbi:asparagine synthase (glutamine-hydrolyzing) [Psychroflexus sp. ALD_RP9]|uniref:asparagine synthase (glutamine-hydrolyzing) n=1 Tax=Psychroflexus sp. ALD_RP9 TaxID=2777186 RepID=UPI001A902DB5|nr:asparagine synthase (glutamine-hydrolyzing) [Psychroflexus sp. ALD_RP9]QSS96406.1 asparagine synthase (glutamine-hydrolyzing) [Psychroflexus sp. ALD_RP9]